MKIMTGKAWQKILVTLTLLSSIWGCKIIQITPADGGIQSASGLYDCPADERCDIVIEEGVQFNDTFTAVALEGRRFVGWEGGDGYLCAGSIEPCVITAPAQATSRGGELFLTPRFDDEDDELQARIHRIENGLVPAYRIEGEPVPTFSMESRLAELGIPGLSMAVVDTPSCSY